MSRPNFIPLTSRAVRSDEELAARAAGFCSELRTRRTVRDFSTRPVPRPIIESCISAAASAPSGANMQPWHFVAVSDPEIKLRIRVAAEAEELEFYQHRAPAEWLDALAAIGTDHRKPFLETASWLIAIFAQPFSIREDGTRLKHYYASESVGISTGFLIAALHHAGLATLTHTPSPMAFLNSILGRPFHEKPFLLLVVGHPAKGALVPDLQRKQLEVISSFL